MNPVGMGHGHIGKADNQPDQKREAAELKERFEILNSVQSLAKSLYTMGHSFAELCRDAAKNSFSEARGAAGFFLMLKASQATSATTHSKPIPEISKAPKELICNLPIERV